MITFYEKADEPILRQCEEFIHNNENSVADYYVFREALSLYTKLSQSLLDSQKEFDEAIAKAENIEITDEKLDEEIAKMAEAYQMEADKLKSFMGDKEKEQMKQDMAVQEAITFVVDNAVEK